MTLIIQISIYCLTGAVDLLESSCQHVIFLSIMIQCYGESIGLPHPLVINLIMDGEDIEGLRERGNAISTTTVTLELLRMTPKLLNVGFIPLCCGVLPFLKKHHYTFGVVAHKD